MNADLAGLRARILAVKAQAEAATPGPWMHGEDGPDGTNMGCGLVWTEADSLFGCNIAEPAGDCYPRSGYSPRDDMRFIAAHEPASVVRDADADLALLTDIELARPESIGLYYPEAATDAIRSWLDAVTANLTARYPEGDNK